MTERIQSIQALRFFAAAAVVYNHSANLALASTGHYGVLASENLSSLGSAGVDIFFVVSGLVITLTGPLASPRPSGLVFFWRRWSRVAPMFFLLTIPTLMWFSIPGPMSPYGAGGPMNTPQTIATLFFWPATTGLIVSPYLSQGWTLSLEMLFYTAVAFVLIDGKMRRNLLILAIVVAAVIWSRWTYRNSGLRVLANRMFVEFGYGVILAFMRPALQRAHMGFSIPLLAAAGAFYLYAALTGVAGAGEWLPTLSDENTPWRLFIFGIPAACIATAALVLEPHLRGRLIFVFGRLGDASYSIYLSHALVLLGLWCMWRSTSLRPPPSFVLVSGFAISISVGVAVHGLAEQPLMKWVRRLSFPPLVHQAGRQVRAPESSG